MRFVSAMLIRVLSLLKGASTPKHGQKILFVFIFSVFFFEHFDVKFIEISHQFPELRPKKCDNVSK
jgi:hypothetical protein